MGTLRPVGLNSPASKSRVPMSQHTLVGDQNVDHSDSFPRSKFGRNYTGRIPIVISYDVGSPGTTAAWVKMLMCLPKWGRHRRLTAIALSRSGGRPISPDGNGDEDMHPSEGSRIVVAVQV